MSLLIGSTGFVGSHLLKSNEFSNQVHKTDIRTIMNLHTDLAVCAGLPAEKWRANREPAEDWSNMANLAQVLTTVQADQAVLISTIDVYQPALFVDELSSPSLDGTEAYGRNRTWFEYFFRAQFPDALIVRLPGLFSLDVRKNLIHDLIHNREDQLANVNAESTFQFFDVTKTWEIIQIALEKDIKLLNVVSAPVTAQEIADVFSVTLNSSAAPKKYDVRSVHSEKFGGGHDYLFTRENILEGISCLAGFR